MAERRMFTMKIVDSDAFLDMPLSAQALYFHLNMRADDDGFVNNPKKIQRMIGASEDDLKLLIAKRFVLIFESGVVVIKHWRMHNLLRKDRYHMTQYQEEMKALRLKDNQAYTEVNNRLETTWQPSDNQMATEDSIGKDSIGKDSIENNKSRNSAKKDKESITNKHPRNIIPPTHEMVSDYIYENGYNVDPDVFMDYYDSKGWIVGKAKMKDWQATVRNWDRKETTQQRSKNPFTEMRLKGELL